MKKNYYLTKKINSIVSTILILFGLKEEGIGLGSTKSTSLINFNTRNTFGIYSFKAALVMLFLIIGANTGVQAQVTVTNPSNTTPALSATYTTLALAIADVNNRTAIAGPVTITLNASSPQTAPAGGYSLTNTAITGGSNTNRFIFDGGGNTITAPAQTSGQLYDAIFKIIGADFITISGFTMQERVFTPVAADTAAGTNTMTEWGVALLETTGSTTNGAQNNIIQNNTISLNRLYQNSFGIYSNPNHTPTAPTTTVVLTNATGSNSFNKFYTNAISNVNFGIVVIGSNALTAVGAMDNGNDIGGSSSGTGNTITNFGGIGVASSSYALLTGNNYAIFSNNQYNDTISFNSITSATGAAQTGTIILGGILKNYSTGSAVQPTGTITTNINNNTVTLTNAPAVSATGSISGINNQGLSALSTATVNINNNTILNCAITGANAISNNLVGITNSSAPGNLNMNSNVIRSLASTATSGQMVGITNSGAVVTALNINSNQLGNTTSGFFSTSTATSGALFGISSSGGAATCAVSISSNDIRGITYSVAASAAQTYIVNSAASPASFAINSNTFTNLNVNTTGSVIFLGHSGNFAATSVSNINGNSIVTAFNKAGAGGSITIRTSSSSTPAGAVVNFQNNNFSNMTFTGATSFVGYNDNDGGAPTKSITGNTFNNITGGTSSIACLFAGFNGNNTTMSNNIITNITGQSSITAITLSGSGTSTTSTCANNTINNLSSTVTGGAVIGISCLSVATTTNLNNNAINTLSSTGAFAVTGISIGGAATTNVFKNKIYDISGSNASTTVNGLLVSAGTTVNTYNNIIGDLRASVASGADVIRGISITSTTATSNQNVYYNTIYLNATSSGTNFGSTGIFHTYNATATTSALDMRNNIIDNASGANGTGLAVAFRRSAATNLNNYASTSNNNLFFGTSGVYTDGTNTDTSLSAFQTRVSTRETASKYQNPTFASTTGANSNFLNFASGAINQSGGFAQVLSSPYTTDYSGATRSGSIPDIGAYEFAEGVAPVPTFTSFTPSSLCVQGGQTVTITGTNLDAVTSVLFNGASGITLAGTITAQTSTSLTVTAPALVVDGNIRVTNSAGFADSASTFTAAPTPTIGVTTSSTICSGTSTSLTATGGATYSWSPATGLSATTGDTVTATPTTTTTYTVTGTSAAGCTATAMVTITVATTPSALSISKNPSTVCAGGVTTLTATGGTITNTAATASQYVMTPSSGTYAAITGTTLGATAIGDDVGIGNLPIGFTFPYNNSTQTVFAASSNGLLLLGNVTVALTGFSANALASTANAIAPLWDDNNTTGGSIIYATTGTAPNRVLTVQWTGMHVAGAGSATNPTINMQALLYESGNIQFIYGTQSAALSSPTASIGISGASANYLSVTPLSPLASSTTSASVENTAVVTTNIPSGTVLTFARPTTATTMLWSGTGLFTDLAATTAYAGQNVNVVYSLNGISQPYTATATSTVSACSSSATVTVSPNPLPTITISPSSASICNGGVGTTLTASGGINYVWSPATGLSATTGSSVTANPTTTTTYTVSGSNANDCSNTATVVVTVNAAVVITGQPTNQIVLENASVSFSVAATGTGLTYQWEENGVAISGATSATYTIASASLSQTGYTYRCVVSGASPCTPVTSTSATLTVGSVSITSQPANQTICSSTSATFTIGTSGDVTSYQWQYSTNGTNWFNVSAATSASLVLNDLTSANSNTYFRCLLNGGAVTSNAATLLVRDVIAITTQPSSQTICSGVASVSFVASATGTGLAYQWEFSTNGGASWANVAGATSGTYTIMSPTFALNGYKYKVIANGTAPCGPLDSSVATLTVNQLVAITAQPVSVNFCGALASTADFTVTATGTGLAYLWEFSTNGGTTWSAYSGGTSATLSVTSPSTYNGNSFRCTVSGTAPCTALVSSVATLTIVPSLGGTMTVGTGGAFATLADAVTAYNTSNCFVGNVVFSLTDATYNLGTTGLSINPNVNAGSYTLTIKPAAGVSPTITGAVDTVGLLAIKANNVTIDGSNAIGGTSRDLTISNTSVTSPRVVIIGSTTTTPITNVAVRNAIIVNGLNANNAVSVTKSDLTAGYFNNITIQNNNIQKAYTGINVNAVVAAGNGSGLLITGNDMTTAGANSIRFRGISVAGVDGATVTNNTISNIVNANLESPIAIFFATGTINGTISGNTVSNCSSTNTGAAAITGISVQSGASTVLVNVTNNTVSNLTNSGTTASFAGITTFSPNTNVNGNTVSNITQNGSQVSFGIIVSGAVNSTISQNIVTNVNASSTIAAGIFPACGINVQGASTGVIVSRNKVSNIKQNYPTYAYGAYGIQIGSSSTTSNIIVINNMIWDVATFAGTTTLAYNALGLYLSAGSGYKIYNNTVNLNTQLSSTGSVVTAAFAIASGVSTAAGLDVRNNVFVNRQTTSATACYAIYSAAANTIFSNINYNDYSVVGTNLGYISSARTNLAGIQTGFGQNVNSLSISPNFASPSNVYMDLETNLSLDNKGTPLADVTNDIDGTTRSATTPDMGAHEFTTLYCADPANAGTTSATPIKLCTTGTATIAATGYSIGVGITFEWEKATDLAFTTPVSMGAASSVYANLATGIITTTTYYRLKAICNAGTVVYSNVSTVTVNTPAVTSVVPTSATICTGGSTTLTASGSSTYAWSPATGLSATTGASVTATPITLTTYTVTGTDANGCTSTATVTITVNANPSAVTVTQGAGSVCANSVMSLTATGGTVSSSSSGKVGSGTAVNTTSTPYRGFYGGSKTQQLYTASELTALGLVANSSISSLGFVVQSGTPLLLNGFTVNAGFVSATTLGSAFISGATTTVFAGTTYTPPTGAGTIDYTLASPITWNGTSSLLVETCFNNNNGGGASTNDLSVESSTVASGLNLYRSQDNIADVCTNLTAPTSSTNRPNVRISYSTSVPTTITWSPTTDLYTNVGATTAYTGQNLNTVYTKPSMVRVYTATANNGACTTASATSTVTPVALPVYTVSSNVTICKGQSTTLEALGTGYTYVWTPALGLNSTTTASVIATPNATTTYTVEATDTSTGCKATQQVVVTVSNPGAILTLGTTTSQTVVPGQSTTFTVAVASGATYSYQWQVNSGSGWSNLSDAGYYSGTTTATLGITSIDSSLDTYQYQCLVAGASPCATLTPIVGTLSVSNTGFAQQPQDVTVCSPSASSFSIVTSGDEPYGIQWQMSTDNGATYADLADGLDVPTGLTFSGIDTLTLSVTGITVTNNGAKFLCVLNFYLPSSAATLTVKTPVAITTPPANQTVCSTGGTATFSATASGSDLAYQWQFSTNGGTTYSTYTGAGFSTATIAIVNPSVGENGNLYRVVVSGNATCAPATSASATLYVNNPTITTQPLATSVLRGNTATFSVAASAATSYQWQLATTLAGTYTNVADATPTGNIYSGATSAVLSVITSATTASGSANFYRCVVTNNGCTVTSTGGQLTVVFYCTPAPTSVDGSGITNVTMGDINNTTGSETGNYGDYSAQSTTAARLSTVNFGITYATGYTYGTKIWIDFDDNGVFTDSGEQVYYGLSTAINPTTLSGSFNIPLSASLGAHRMRIGGSDDDLGVDPCYASSYGTFEDYTIVITPAPTCSGTPVAGTVAAGISSLCSGGAGTTLTLTGFTTGVLGISYQWNYSANGTSFTPISGATTTTLATGSLTANAYYHCTVSCSESGLSATSTTVAITVANPLLTGSTPSGRCGTGVVTLGATANAGATVIWYAAATGGSTLSTGDSFTSPSIASSTTYYAEASNGVTTVNGLGNTSIPTATGASAERGIVFTATTNGTLLSAQYYSPTLNVTNTVTVKLVNHSTGVQVGSSLTLPIVQGSTAGFYTMNLNLALTSGITYRLLASFSSSVNRISTGADYSSVAFTNLSPIGTITSGYDGAVSTTSYNYFHNIAVVTASCSSARTAVLATVDTLPTATVSYAGSPFCSSATIGAVTRTGTPGGTYSSTVGLTIDGSTGTVDVTTSTPGSYVVTYAMNGTTYCASQTTTTSVVINQALTSGFAYDFATYCTNQGTATPTVSGSAGVFTSSPAGLSINAATGVITLASSTAGTYTVTNTVSVGGCANSVSTATVTVNNAVVITSQPVNVSQLPGDNTSFSVVATGTGLTYQWQVNDGSGYLDISGATASSLSLTAVTAEMNGYLYRVIVSGAAACSPVTSNVATLTVNSAVVASQPANYTACNEGATSATFAITTTGTVTSYQWQVSTNGTTWSNITNGGIYANADTATLLLSGLSLSNDGNQFRCALNGAVNSNAATLTIKTAVAITSQPSNTIGCSAGSASFTVAGSGSGLSYQWQLSTNGTSWTSVSGATSAILTLSSLTFAMNGYQYQAIVSGASPCSAVTSLPATLTVNNAVAIATQPSSTTLCANGTGSLTVIATGTGLTYQWELNSGSGYAPIGGATSASLVLSSVTSSMSGYLYRVIVSGATACSSVTSSGASLTVNQPAAATFTPATSTVCANGIQMITAVTTSFASFAQPGVVGTGTVSNTTNIPFRGYYGGAKVQYLYTAAELTALGYSNGTLITSLGFDITAYTSPYTFNGFTIGMKNTASTVLTTTLETGLTTVKNASNYTLTGTAPFTATLPLDATFTWNGTSNVLIEFCFNNNNSGGVSANSANTKSSTMATAMSAYYSADNIATLCSTTTGTTSTSRANMRFGVQSGSITWTPITGLYTNAAATTAYIAGVNASTVYVKTTNTTTYTATVTNLQGCSNTSTTTVTVQTPSTLSSITQPLITCSGTQTTFNLTGLLSSSTSTLTYTVNGGAPATKTNVVADASGNASFTLALAGFTNGQTLAITSIQRTDLTPSCSTAISSGNTVTIAVQPLVTYYADADGDGYGDYNTPQVTCQGQPSGYVTNSTDCNDTDNTKHATFPFYADTDSDGYGAGSAVSLCTVNATTPPVGYVTNNTDCNDADATMNTSFPFYADTDSDGYGAGSAVSLCAVNATTPPAGYVTNNTDCNDADATMNASFSFYADTDGDGYGAGTAVSLCAVNAITPPAGYSVNNTDCAPTDVAIHQMFTFYVDADGDGYGIKDASSVCAVNATTPPAGYSVNNTDCDDSNAAVYQSASLYIDADQDGYNAGQMPVCYGASVPTGFSLTTSGSDCNDADATKHASFPFYADADGDGYGAGSSVSVCAVDATTPPAGYSLTDNDCNDTDPLRNPTNPCESVVTVKMNIEGYYDSVTHAMRSVLANQGVGTSTTDVDTVTIELHDATTFALVTSTTAMLQTNGNAVATFSTAPTGSFYIVVRHRNSLETWSGAAQTVGATSLTYDFTTAADKAYGSNMKMLESGVYGFYSGDINQDGFIEGEDYAPLFTAIESLLEGYQSTDVNGDGFVEGEDIPYLYNNSESLIEVIHP